MAFVVVYDACVLHPAPLRDLLVRIAGAGIVRARWSDQVLDECFDSILASRPDLTGESLQRTRRLMIAAVPDCLVSGYENLIESLSLPDPNDRHVLAAAIRGGAQAIVTFNTKDFPADALAAFDVEVKHPDDFVLESIDIAPGLVTQIVSQQASALRKPPRTVPELLDMLSGLGLVRSVVALRELL